MELKLSENIRLLRKSRRLTQEQLAEVLGVTTGAVYKWESGLSVPELHLILEMADFFDTSVDVLLGYTMKDNRLSSITERLRTFLRNGDPEALPEAEKALKKYPNSFDVVHRCAEAYLIFGMESRRKEDLRRALELLEQALMLISQNTDPEISEYTIFGEMGGAYIALGEQEKGLEILKKHNAGGMFSDDIGAALAVFLHRPEEAEPFLSEALLRGVAHLVNAVAGYAFVYSARGDYSQERAIVSWGRELLLGLKAADVPSFMDKAQAVLLTLLAHAQIRTGDAGSARMSLQEAAGHVRRFDAAPDFSFTSARFIAFSESVSMHDSLGVLAEDSVETLIGLLEEPSLTALWEAVANDG